MIEVIRRDSTTVQTVGLREQTGFELRLDAIDLHLLSSAETMLYECVKYQLSSGVAIRPGETVEWGCGLVRFQPESEVDVLEAFEKGFEDGSFKKGAMATLALWQGQREVCHRHKADFDPPRPSTYCVASPDLLVGDGSSGIEGVRYPYAAQNSGWWLFGPTFDGIIENMKRVHLVDVMSKLGSAREYFALPAGFAFCTDQGEERVWFEHEAASRPPI